MNRRSGAGRIDDFNVPHQHMVAVLEDHRRRAEGRIEDHVPIDRSTADNGHVISIAGVDKDLP